MTSPRLTIELVPRTSWTDNVRKAVKPAVWDLLRRTTYGKAGCKCEICGGIGAKHPVECHEIWEYDDVAHVQYLRGLISLCPSCHEVKHFGLAELRGYGQRALGHLMKVNGWSKDEAVAYVRQAGDKWVWRSQYQWVVNLDWLEVNDVNADDS